MKALITGITGQDGSYLAELLLSKGYEVHGVVRRSSIHRKPRLSHLTDRLHLHDGDVLDHISLANILRATAPTEIYHLAAQSHVGTSYSCPKYTTDVILGGTLNLLEAAKHTTPTARIYNAATSEMFGNSPAPQTESTPLAPLSPYACAKEAAYHLTHQYRSQGMHISNGILFNHESPRRGENFVTRKVTLGVASIYLSLQDKLHLGNLTARRDWGYAPEYVEAMWLMLQQPAPDDYVISTGIDYSVEDFVMLAFREVGLDWHNHVIQDSQEHLRPLDVPVLCGKPLKAFNKLGWKATTDLPTLVKLMVNHDIEMLRKKGYLLG